MRKCVNTLHPGSVMVGCRKNVTRVLGHHGNSMCSPSGLVVKPSLGRAKGETVRSPPSHLLFISLF